MPKIPALILVLATAAHGAPTAIVNPVPIRSGADFVTVHSYDLPLPMFVHAGDFTGDGKRDVVVGVSGKVHVNPGGGNGTFTAPVTTVAGLPFFAADLNGDGRDDLAVRDAAGLRVLTSIGGGDFSATSIALASPATAAAAAHFDGDGILDLAITTPTATFVHRATGSG